MQVDSKKQQSKKFENRNQKEGNRCKSERTGAGFSFFLESSIKHNVNDIGKGGLSIMAIRQI